MMHEHGKSDTAIGAVKPANVAERSGAEWAEQRSVTEGNVDQQPTCRTQSRAAAKTA
jgi:RNA-directed DNA polymerase